MKKENKWEVEIHSGIDKSFGMGNDHIWMKVDYDDVNHPEVDAAVKCVQEIMEKHWDEKLYESHYINVLLAEWKANEYNLQADYDDKDDYLLQNGITIDRIGKII